jgi:Ca2+-dependent lipid-binding protein
LFFFSFSQTFTLEIALPQLFVRFFAAVGSSSSSSSSSSDVTMNCLTRLFELFDCFQPSDEELRFSTKNEITTNKPEKVSRTTSLSLSLFSVLCSYFFRFLLFLFRCSLSLFLIYFFFFSSFLFFFFSSCSDLREREIKSLFRSFSIAANHSRDSSFAAEH